ncbi:uncharacterized protein BX664DRAFT_103127 [Halteromyces radiatus]|uniref:uncharacterized protein n=1 Tax=Halteromyces radiatus TaxID=101107 RepID=UPI00221F7881|nr:uncharacterized protein BX664DRAFT_103127 [Halteromyces radiatus]KAI8093229.1 hypothetical protein BX664DRAFT_103127 [Halteromyces radiatus]
MPVPFMNNPYLPLSYSPVPQIFMASTPVESLSNGDHIPGNMSMTKMGYPDPAMTSNLTSMPVQATVMATNNLTDNPPTSIQQETGSISSPSTPMHQPITDSKSTKESSSMSNSTNQSPVQSAIPTKVIYHPKTRQVETHGGVDLKYFDKFEIRPAIPYIEELGTVDITALTMSLKSGMKMEVTTALNTITTLSLLPRVLLLVHCEDLLDCLLDHLETCLFESNLRDYLKENENDSPDVTIKSSMYTYADLFEAALLEMKSLIPALEPTCSDEWIPLRDRCLCIFNLLRNLSFMEENAEYLATHPRLTHLLMRIILSSENHHTLTTTGNSTNNDTVSSPSSPSVAVENISKIRSMDLLDFRKSILVIYSNIALAMKKLTIHPEATVSVVHLIYEFLVNDSETYYSLLAMETWNKFAVHEEHRQLLGSLLQTESDNGICSDHDNKDDDENNKEHEANKSDGCDNDNMFNDDNKNYSKGNRNNKSSDDKDIVHIPMSQYIQGIWISLIGMLRRHFYLIEMGMTVTSNNTQLAILEMIVMGLYHVVAIADTNFCDKLIQADRGIAMTILRICMTLAEADNVHYRVVAQRGMEMVYVLILGGGCKVTELVRQKRQYGRFQQQQQQQQQQKHHNHYQQQQQQQYQKQHSMFPITNDDLGDEESSYKIGVTLRARILLNHNVLQEKLMMAMLKPISDNFILTGLDDLLNLMDEMTLYD